MSSSDFTTQVHYSADSAAVYAALATPDGVRGWWGTDATVGTAPGELIRLGWSERSYIELRIQHLVQDREVMWTCVAQRDENLPHPDEWLGTDLTFLLRPSTDVGTDLSFTHHGLRPELACYDMCAGGWDWFLRHSLYGWLEAGKGAPFQPTADRLEISRPPKLITAPGDSARA